ncbi:MAG: bifunctional hydroxymethylpyrimidine kinase/phosphomethylpyrimidine kinase [Zoogloeaceae bacterium]|nr:bifunctional hydroxymethylpyrimidine kinase/phosphomethylpyrimidine kinase [Rhodocyclaceae bacterium]MCP5239827.1 bifunctional hydroxymethylpyrimidine kinase/phosphomethylpyrimidine kinase [Zoogloeaceae bacterium]MCP5253936.1 bifunctional hydroxymethylpyrimidine kinase/phosphomethylpyrimidine kinase [Zoogloeaceae bacterium]MCP5293672.1 bifunctional hydroxymethylpyrimidine kinase/phosphomethylpyrimidine kinase [Zoogloeaceae bacterium]MCW5615148.1 bifunctional hydroxymethylpyrimidine kinase/ph
MSSSSIPNVLTIAGTDPSGGAGVLADLKAFSALGAYGCAVIAALTAQNTRAVSGVHTPPVDFLKRQIDTLFEDVRIDSVKLGMLGTADIVRTVADRLAHFKPAHVVLDPVMVAKSGDHLLAKSAVAMLKEALMPQANMITPNLPEAGVLLEQRAPESTKEMFRAAERLRELLPTSSERWVLLKGGHLPGNELLDLLFDGDRMIEMRTMRIDTPNTHGTGCTLSSAIAALLPQRSAQLQPVAAAVRDAQHYLQGAIAASGALKVGTGHGPVHHFYRLWRA